LYESCNISFGEVQAGGIGNELVTESLRKTVGGKPVGMGGNYNCDTEVIGLELNILGKKMNFHISAGKDQARLADIVPLARIVCTKITDVVLQSVISNGGRIACRKGCLACCRHLIPLSVPEAFRLDEEISAATEHRRKSVWRTCLDAARQILDRKPPIPLMPQKEEASPASSVDLNLISKWYRDFELDCPFLHNGVCTIYEQRPLACREHYVTGSAEACRGKRGAAKVLEMPVQMPNALSQLASELEGTSVEAVLLPLALVWCEENHQRDERTWPFAMMVKRFLEIITEMACENSMTLRV
jgi:Fe-S-cluster containining protein